MKRKKRCKLMAKRRRLSFWMSAPKYIGWAFRAAKILIPLAAAATVAAKAINFAKRFRLSVKGLNLKAGDGVKFVLAFGNVSAGDVPIRTVVSLGDVKTLGSIRTAIAGKRVIAGDPSVKTTIAPKVERTDRQ